MAWRRTFPGEGSVLATPRQAAPLARGRWGTVRMAPPFSGVPTQHRVMVGWHRVLCQLCLGRIGNPGRASSAGAGSVPVWAESRPTRALRRIARTGKELGSNL